MSDDEVVASDVPPRYLFLFYLIFTTFYAILYKFK